MKTMKLNGMIQDGNCGAELNIDFDNCSGQNKTNTVLKLVPNFVEMVYFNKMNFIFLAVEHTKNATNYLFNFLKKENCRRWLIHYLFLKMYLFIQSVSQIFGLRWLSEQILLLHDW